MLGNSLKFFVAALLLSGMINYGVAEPALSIKDIPQIVASGEDGFNKYYKGHLFTAQMTVNDVIDKSNYFSVGFNTGEHQMFPPISCNAHNLEELGPAQEGKLLWVSGIASDLMGDTLFLDPCEISYTENTTVVHPSWKLHPPRQ